MTSFEADREQKLLLEFDLETGNEHPRVRGVGHSGPRLPSAVLTTLRKIGGSILTVWVASVVLFGAISLAPGNAVSQIVGPHPTLGEVASLTRILGLNKPLPLRYWEWLIHAVRGNFGNSLVFRNQSVASLVMPRLLVTLSLVAYAAFLILFFGLTVGVIGGMFRRTRVFVALICGLGISIPTFFAAELLIVFFAVHWSWFPVTGVGTGFFGRLHSLTLPAIALAIGWFSYVAQLTNAAIREEAMRPYVETERGRGLSGGVIFRRYILRGAAIPIVTVSGLSVAGLFAGAIVVEQAFGIGGIGSLLVASVSGKDPNVVLAISIILVFVFMVVTTTIDLLQPALDPRIGSKVKSE